MQNTSHDSGDDGGSESSTDEMDPSQQVPDLTGKTLEEAERILKEHGFTDEGLTGGGEERGYRKFYNGQSRIQIRISDGRVSRTGRKIQNSDPNKKGYRPRFDQYGNKTSSHDTGEFIKQ